MTLQRKKQMDPNEVLKKVMDLNDSLWENSDTDDEDDGECGRQDNLDPLDRIQEADLNEPDLDDHPASFFEQIFGEDTFQYIAQQTDLYASQKSQGQYKWEDTTSSELKLLLGMLDVHDYWSQDPLLAVPGIVSGMPRTRFKMLMRNLHLNDNSQMLPRTDSGYDRLHKIRPLLDTIITNTQATSAGCSGAWPWYSSRVGPP